MEATPKSDLVIVSGGQTGADRAALDFAIKHGIQHGGWCPLGRLAEDGPLAEKYLLQETTSSRYDQRTRRNVRESDATLIVTIKKAMTGGTALTAHFAKNLKKPWLQISRDAQPSLESAGELVQQFLLNHKVKRLNVAGPRASSGPEISQFVHDVLLAALDPLSR